MELNEIRLFSPATVANVSCGFDVLGFCLDTVGDEMVIRKTDERGIRITKITGYDLPYKVTENVAGISALAMYNTLKPECGFEIEIHKKIKPGSGIGSSSASAAGSVFGMNVLLGDPLNKTELTSFAMKGEAFASKAEHADNLAPAIFGGFTIVKSIHPLHIIELPTPKDLYATIIHPQIEIKTSDARALLPQKVPLRDSITQWANLGSLVHALHTSDYDLIALSLNDVIVEPHRKSLIPDFDTLKEKVIKAGALGCGISGSGPSIYTLSQGIKVAEKVEDAMFMIYESTSIPFDTHVSKINTEGIKIIK
ncbi:homoserine kinase [Winogradskyella sp. DF17]|uniref:Homoserine kinase n=1 Tax=Winogradskyella pelagia TaxID=2819984 RepID=A0ABS3T436_9FLAO|nr:homoserine kinase [Winogradskyella sp. DF17]MBO3117513.1 homoserine kinase [Winogradskyella sp. DF17]